MNKKFFAAVAIAALMGVGGYFAKSATTQNDGLSDLELANAEALAENEEYIVVQDKIPCHSSYFVEPLEKFVYCLGCVPKTGHATGESGECTDVRFVPMPTNK